MDVQSTASAIRTLLVSFQRQLTYCRISSDSRTKLAIVTKLLLQLKHCQWHLARLWWLASTKFPCGLGARLRALTWQPARRLSTTCVNYNIRMSLLAHLRSRLQ